MDEAQFNQLSAQFSSHKKLHGFDRFFQAAVLIPLVLLDHQYHLLFEKRATQISQGDEICFPGGKIDPKDSSAQGAAIRETCEELGCQPTDVEILGKLDTLILPTGVMVQPYLGVLRKQVTELTASPNEVQRIFTVPLSFFLQEAPKEYHCEVWMHPYVINTIGEKEVFFPAEELDLPQRYHEPWGKTQRKIYVYQTAGETIWGLTAEIIYELVQQIKEFDL